MYSMNSKKKNWWDKENVIIWGASAKLAGNDPQVQAEILEMKMLESLLKHAKSALKLITLQRD